MAQPLVLAPRRIRAGVLVPGAALVLGGWVVLAVARDHASTASFATMWLAMCVAMMIPTALRPMMRAAQGSVAGAWRFTAGFLAVWTVAGLPTYVVMNSVEWTAGWIATTWVLAGAYQLTPLMQRNLTTCRSVRFAGDPTAYGARQGLRCVASCWPVMLAVMVTAMALPGTVLPLVALVAVTALLCWEKQPGTTARAVASVGMAMLLVAAGGAVLFGGGGGGEAHHSTGTSTS
jgi:predicted metal-binding membrane protein